MRSKPTVSYSCLALVVAASTLYRRPFVRKIRTISGLKSLVLLTLLLASLRVACGGPVTAAQAKGAVTGWLRSDAVPLHTTMGPQVKKVDTFRDSTGMPLYYIAYTDPSGFVIVSADDLIEPIIGFAPAGQFDPSTNNPLGALVSSDLPGRLALVKAAAGTKTQSLFSAAKDKWAQLQTLGQKPPGTASGLASVSDPRVAPLTQTLWDQTTAGGNACYNYYTPPYAAGTANNYPCGCTATAMAQLMRFWQYPVNSVGTASFTITVDGVSQSRSLRGGNGAGGPYVWSNMALSPSTATERQAVGALCADAAVAAESTYTSAETGSNLLKARNAVRNTFGYTSAVFGWNSNLEIGSGLPNMINPGLDAGCVAILGITKTSGGHAVVCDGYGYNSSTLYHHLNLGWSGTATAWYNLPTIDTGTGNGTYNVIPQCLYNAWPSGTGEIISGRITDSGGSPISGASVSATRSAGGTYTATSDAKGIYALSRIPSASTYTISISKAGYAFSSRSTSTSSSSDYSATSGNVWGFDFTPIPATLTVTPASALASSGSVGGPFSPSSQVYTLGNSGSGTLAWTASKSSSWVSLSLASGSLGAGGSANVTVSVGSGANSLASGSYSDTVTFANTTTGLGNTSRAVSLTVNPTAFAVSGGGAYCSSGAGVSVSVSGSETGVNYYLKRGGTTTVTSTSGTGSAITFNNLTVAGTYTVVATNATVPSSWASMTGSAGVTVNTRPTAIASGGGTICSGGSASIQAALTGTGPWNVGWSDGVNQNGVVASPATRSASPSAATTYTVTSLTDANCTAQAEDRTGSAVVTVNSRPTSAVSGSATICNGGSPAIAAALTGAGPWNVGWSDGVNQNGVVASPATRTTSPSATTTYTVTSLTDANCTAQAGDRTGSAVVTVNSRPTSAASGSATICNGGSTAIAAALTGTGPWTVGWSDGVNQNGVVASPATRTVSPSATTTYTVTSLTDANCTAQAGDRTGSAVVTVNSRPTSAASGSATICNGGSTAIAAALTGTGPWTVGWSDGVNQNGVVASPATRTVSPSATTTYTVTSLTDANCTAQAGDRTGSAVVTIKTRPTSVVSASTAICNGGSTTISAALTGTGPWNVNWSDGINQNGVVASPATRSVSPSATTTYTVISLTDANCTAQAGDRTGSAVVTVNSRPTSVASGSATICNGGTATISATLTGTGPWNVNWSDGINQNGVVASPATRSVSPSATTTYTVISLTDANCTAQTGDRTGNAVVTVNSRPTSVVSGSTAICNGSSTVIAAALTGTGPWNVGWSDGINQNGVLASPATRTVSPLATTTYTVTSLADANCTAQAGDRTGSAVVTVISAPLAAFSASRTNGGVPLTVTFTNLSSGATSYLWDFGDGHTNTNVNPTYIYTASGSNTVSLTAISSCGTNMLALTNYIVVTNTPALLVVSPTNGILDTVVVGQSSTQAFQVVNAGGLPLTGSATTALPFSVVTGSPFTVPVGQTGVVQVAFSPTQTGTFTTNLLFTSNGGNATNALSGTAVTPGSIVVSPASTNFGVVLVGTNASAMFVVTNTGGGPVSNGMASVGAPFSIASGGSFGLSGFGSTNVVVRFTPAGDDTFSTNVIFISSGGNSTNLVSGVGQTPGQIAVAPTNWDFGWVAVSNTADRTFVVTNRGGAPVTSGAVGVSPPFSVVSGSSFTVAGFGTTNVVVRFAPTNVAVFSTNLVLSSANGGTVTNLVSGRGALMPVTSFTANRTSGLAPLTVMFTDTSIGTITNWTWAFGDGITNSLTTNVVLHSV